MRLFWLMVHVAELPLDSDESSRKHPGNGALLGEESYLAGPQKFSESAPRGVKLWIMQLFPCQEKEQIVRTLCFSLHQVLMEDRQLAESVACSRVSCFSLLPAPPACPSLWSISFYKSPAKVCTTPSGIHGYTTRPAHPHLNERVVFMLQYWVAVSLQKSADRWLTAPHRNKPWDSLSTDRWSMCTF